MKLLTLVVVLTLLAAGQAEGQEDSMIMTLHFRSPYHGCSFWVTSMRHYAGFSYSEGLVANLDLQTKVVDSMRVTYQWQDATSSRSGGIAFNIDTFSNLIRNLSVYVDSGWVGNGGNNNCHYIATIDSISITRSSQNIGIPARYYPCGYTIGAYYESDTESGQGSSNGRDSVMLELELSHSLASVGVAPVPPHLNTHINDGNHVFRFEDTEQVRMLQVSNMLGETIFRSLVRPHETFMQFVLPPGCYFARLGNQVAKFVVME